VADADEPFGPLNDLFVACFGTFLLKEEPMGIWTKIGYLSKWRVNTS
jgi:hypothetical protein